MAEKEGHNIAPVEHEYVVHCWDMLEKKGDEGRAVPVRDYSRATFQVEGGTVEIRGSIMGERYDILTDNQGLPLIIMSNGIMTTDDDVCFVKPVNIGDSSAQVSMIARR